jgi:Domain of unknown function (DUF4347)
MGRVISSGSGGGPITVSVIDDRDHVGWAAAATRLGEYSMTNVETMVAAVLKAKGNRKIGRLNILDHGNEDGFEVGDDWVTLATLDKFPQLTQLRGLYSTGGYVHLQGCNVGRATALMQRLANMWEIKVVAGTGLQNPVYRINTGKFVECLPNNGGCRDSSDQRGAIGYH